MDLYNPRGLSLKCARTRGLSGLKASTFLLFYCSSQGSLCFGVWFLALCRHSAACRCIGYRDPQTLPPSPTPHRVPQITHTQTHTICTASQFLPTHSSACLNKRCACVYACVCMHAPFPRQSLHVQKSDVDLLRTKLRCLEEENNRKDRQIEQLLDPSRVSPSPI